jgi:hypothetical protein
MTETVFTPSLERVSCVLSILIFHLLKERKKQLNVLYAEYREKGLFFDYRVLMQNHI